MPYETETPPEDLSNQAMGAIAEFTEAVSLIEAAVYLVESSGTKCKLYGRRVFLKNRRMLPAAAFGARKMNDNCRGVAGRPNGPDFEPLITVRLEGLQFSFYTPLLSGMTLSMPDFRASLTSEDGST